MKRPALVAVLAIAILFGGSMALVHRVTGPAATGDPAPTTDPAATTGLPEPPVPTPAARPIPAKLASRTPRGAGPGATRASWNPPAEDPSAIPLANRVIRMAVRKALLAASTQARLAGCVERGGGFGGADSPARVPRGQPAALMLELEVLPDEVRVVEAQVRGWGEASQQMAACAREVLRGQAIAMADSGGARRVRMPFPLSPRSEPLAAR